MGIKIGINDIKMCIGDKDVSKAYLGNNLIYQNELKCMLINGQDFNTMLKDYFDADELSYKNIEFLPGIIPEESRKYAQKVNIENDIDLYIYRNDDTLCVQAICENVKVLANENCMNMFKGTKFQEVDLTGVDFEDTTMADYMLNNMSNVKKIKFNWKCKMSNLFSALSMFSDNPILTEITNIQYWEPTKLYDMDSMFYCDKKLELLYLMDWRTPILSYMSMAFYGCENLTGNFMVCNKGISCTDAFNGDYTNGFACDNPTGFDVHYINGLYDMANELCRTQNMYSNVRLGEAF